MHQPSPTAYRNKVILLTAVVTMVVTSIAWIGIGVAGFWLMYTEPPSFEIRVDHPEVAMLGAVIEVKVSVKNTGAEEVDLANVDVYDGLVDGFEMIDVTPKPSSSERIWGYHSYNFYKKLAPGDTHDLTLKMRAKEVGFWAGDIDACNTMQNMVTYYTEIEVMDAPAEETTVEEE